MERKAKIIQDELEKLRKENKRLRELVAQLIQNRITEVIEPRKQLAGAED